MCFTTFAPAIYAVDAVSPTATMTVPEGLVMYDGATSEITEGSSVSVSPESENGDPYRYDYTGGVIKFYASEDGQSLKGKKVVFFVEAEIMPTVESSVSKCTPKVDLAESNVWKITLSFSGFGSYGDATLTYKAGVEQYTVSFPSSSDYTLEANGEPVTGEKVSYGKGTEVNVTLTAFDEAKDFEVYVGTEKQTLVGGQFSFTVDKNVSITVRPIEKKFTVSLSDGSDKTGFTYAPASSTSVTYNGTFQFYVNPADGYGDPNVTAKMGEADANLSNNGNQWFITDITGDVVITVTAGKPITHSVTVFAGEGVADVSENKTGIANDGTYVLSFEVDPAYSKSTPVVTVNSTRVNAVKGDNDVYTCTISGIKEDKTVEISGLAKNTYKVTTSVAPGCTIVSTDSTTVAHGDTYTFNVKVDAGYTLGKVTVTEGCELTTNQNGSYTVTVVKDATISVTATANTYRATANVTDISDFTVDFTTANENIPYGGTYSFKVTAKEGFRVTNVLVNGAAVTGTNGVYTVSNVTADQNIEVDTTANLLNVTYVSNEKNHGVTNSEVTYTLAELTKLPTIDGCTIHTFVGWVDENGKSVTLDSLKALIKNATADVNVTLTAKFELNEQAVREEVLKLDKTTKVVTGTDGNYTVMFRTGITPKNKDNQCIIDLVKITAYGTLLGRGDIDFNSTMDMIVNRAGSETEYGFNQQEIPIFGNNYSVYNSYYESNYSWNTFLSYTTDGDRLCLMQINTGLKSEINDRNAAGWIEITIGDQSFVIISAASGTVAQ